MSRIELHETTSVGRRASGSEPDRGTTVILCLAVLALALLGVKLLWAGDPAQLISAAAQVGIAP